MFENNSAAMTRSMRVAAREVRDSARAGRAAARVDGIGARAGLAALILTLGGSAFGESAPAPQAAPPAPSPAKRAIDERKAIFTLVGSNFRSIGEVLQGKAQYDAAELRKRTTRVAFLAGLAAEAFPEVSNAGSPATRAKAEIWTDRADFNARLKDFTTHTQALAQLVSKQDAGSDEFKAAAGAVANDCKGCHDTFREK